MTGAGGSDGGIGRFFIGLAMMIAGGYLFLNAIRVTHHFSFGHAMFSWGSFNLTSGMTMIPFIFGIGIIFYNSRSILGWILTCASLIMLGFGIISTIQFSLRSMSAYELTAILTLMLGGLGLFLSSLRDFEKK